MNSTRNRPEATTYPSSHARFAARIEEVQAIVRGSSSPHAVLEAAVTALEKLIPALSQFLAAQSLLSQDWDTAGRQRMEEHLNQSRSKLRELQVLAESARRVVSESTPGGSNPVAEALNAYLVPSLDDMKEAILAQAEVREGGRV